MKKILSVFVVLGMISCALFAKESSNKWYENLSAGGLLRLGVPTYGLEIHNRYESDGNQEVQRKKKEFCLTWN